MTEVLPWTHFTFIATSCGHRIIGIYHVCSPITLDDLKKTLLNRAVIFAARDGIAWNPFNVTLLVEPIITHGYKS